MVKLTIKAKGFFFINNALINLKGIKYFIFIAYHSWNSILYIGPSSVKTVMVT